MAAVFAGIIAYCVRTGKIIDFGGLTSRRREPRLFWVIIAFYGVCGLISLLFWH